MNDYFANCTKLLKIKDWDSAANENGDQFANHQSIKSISQLGYKELQCFSKIKTGEVHKILCAINVKKKVSGKVPNFILKLAKTLISQPLTNCINKTIEKGHFPSELKIAEITTIYKKDDPLNVENYRPISILPALSKVYEKVLKKQLENFFVGKLSPLLCGFRKGFSTQHALLKLLQNCQKASDSSEYVGMVLMDLSKAYDCIPHELLIAKLKAYGLDDKSLRLLRSYLSCRKQRVKVGSFFSTLLESIKGIPQGSVLGPLLFNVFINDLLLFYKETLICNYADDNTLMQSSINIEEIQSKLQAGIDSVLNWFKDNSMKANPDKFQLIVLSRTRNIKMNLQIEETSIESKNQVKLLGVTLDSRLLFTNHINNICDKAGKRLLALLRIRKYLCKEQAKILSISYILSVFKYCNLLWMFCPKSENERINKIHKRTLRYVYNSPLMSFDELLEEHQLNDFHTQNLQSLMCFIHDVVLGDYPELVRDTFEVKDIGYNLRSKYLLELPNCSSVNYGINTIFFKGVLLWKNLPNNLKEIENPKIFKKEISLWKPRNCTCKICH